jgi:hypothetical protein
MDPLGITIAGKLIEITWDAFSEPVKAYISQLFKHKDPSSKGGATGLQHSDGIAVGVAIGYFHNFLQPLDETIANDRLLVFATELLETKTASYSAATLAEIGEEAAKQMSLQRMEKHELVGTYDGYHFEISIVYPQELEKQNFGRVNDYLWKETQKGSYFNRPNSRPYGINYTVDGKTIHIYDYARPIEAVWKYYRDDKKLSQEDIELIQAEEIQLFLAVIRRLMKDNTRHLYSHSEFVPIK